MKWRDGVFVICPFCAAARTGGDQRSGGKMVVLHKHRDPKERDTLATRRHFYECGCEIVEGWLDNDSDVPQDRVATSVVAACQGALFVLSKGLSYTAVWHDLSTLCTFEQAEMIADRTANVTAMALYKHVRNSALIQDNYRLPPVPLMDAHVRILAEERAKR